MSIFEAMVLEKELDAMRLRAERAEAELAALRVPCQGHDDDAYPWQLPPKAFCPTCGHPVQVAE